jgi:hypothetical protein
MVKFRVKVNLKCKINTMGREENYTRINIKHAYNLIFRKVLAAQNTEISHELFHNSMEHKGLSTGYQLFFWPV